MKKLTTGRAKGAQPSINNRFAKQNTIFLILLLLAVCSLLITSGCWFEKKDGENMDGVAEEEITAEDITEEDLIEPSAELEAEIEAFASIVTDENADSSSCASLEDEDLKQSCEQKFVYKTAVASGDESMCTELLNEYDVESCLGEIAQ